VKSSCNRKAIVRLDTGNSPYAIKRNQNGIPLKAEYNYNTISSGATKSIHQFWGM